MDAYSYVVEVIITSVISSHDGTMHGDMAVSSPWFVVTHTGTEQVLPESLSTVTSTRRSAANTYKCLRARKWYLVKVIQIPLYLHLNYV